MNELVRAAPTCVVGVLIDKLGYVCAISRKPKPGASAEERNRARADLGLPGGKVERGETEVQALVRELHEELGILVTDAERVWACMDSDGHWTVAFVVNSWEGEPRDAEGKGADVVMVKSSVLQLPHNSWHTYNRSLFSYLRTWAEAQIVRAKAG